MALDVFPVPSHSKKNWPGTVVNSLLITSLPIESTNNQLLESKKMSAQPITDEDAVAAADKEMEERANRAKELLSQRYVGLKRAQVSMFRFDLVCSSIFACNRIRKSENCLKLIVECTVLENPGRKARSKDAVGTANDWVAGRKETEPAEGAGARRDAHSEGIEASGYHKRL